MTTVSTNVKNGSVGPNYDVLGDNVTKDGVTGIIQYLSTQAKRRDADTTITEADGDYAAFTVDRRGRLRVTDTETITSVSVTPAINTAIYGAGDQVGAVNTFAGASLVAGGAGRVMSAILTDRAKQKANLQLWLFAVSPTLVGANNALLDITDANLEAAKPVGFIDFLTADYRDTVSNSACMGRMVNGIQELPYVTSGGTSIFGVLATTGTPTYLSATDLVLTLNLRPV